MHLVRLKQRALVGLEMFYGDNRDDTHMFQLIKAHDVAQHIRRKQVCLSVSVSVSVTGCSCHISWSNAVYMCLSVGYVSGC